MGPPHSSNTDLPNALFPAKMNTLALLLLFAIVCVALASSSSTSSSSSSSSSSSTSDSTSDEISNPGGKENRQDRRIEQAIKAQLQKILDADPANEPAERRAYQIKASRTESQGVNTAESPSASRRIGLLVVIAKTTPGNVEDDSFDGNMDGQLDVKAARDNWAAQPATSTQEAAVARFLQEVRNRAQVNGGS